MKHFAVPILFGSMAAGAVALGAVATVTTVPAPAPAPPASRALPWLRGLGAAVETTEELPGVVARMAEWRAADPACSAAAYGGFELAADVAGEPGIETVLASFTQGVLVLDARAQLIASAMPAQDCQGSADDLAGIAAGDAHIGVPVIALAATTGGHRSAVTSLVLYRVGDGVVAPIFAGIVEDQTGDRTRVGEVTLLRGSLSYRDPSGVRTLWIYDAEQRVYVPVTPAVPSAPGV